jgi:hypothetical protein
MCKKLLRRGSPGRQMVDTENEQPAVSDMAYTKDCVSQVIQPLTAMHVGYFRLS